MNSQEATRDRYAAEEVASARVSLSELTLAGLAHSAKARDLEPRELADVYNELHPENKITESDAKAAMNRLGDPTFDSLI